MLMVNSKILLFLFFTLSFSSCDKETFDLRDKITFDNIKIECEVLPTGNYNAIRFTSPKIAYTISSNGGIYKTEDGGSTWTFQDSGTELPLFDMFFLDDFKGFVVGGNGTTNEGIILSTVNGGGEWTPQIFPESITAVYFLNNTIGFAIGKRIYKTQNFGETWSEVSLDFLWYDKIKFFDQATGLLTATTPETLERIVLKTTDGGNTWFKLNNISLSLFTVNKIQILNGSAYIISNAEKIFKTPDQGSTWTTIIGPSANSVHFINERQAVAVGAWWYDLGYFPDGVLYLTNDGGNNWEKKLIGPEKFLGIKDIDFSSDSTSLAVGANDRGCVIHLEF